MGKITYDENTRLKEYAQKFLNGKFCCADNQNDEKMYRDIMNSHMLEDLSERLSAIGYELINNAMYKTMYIRKQDDLRGSRYNIDSFTTRVILTLMRKYMLQMRNSFDFGRTSFYKWNDLIEETKTFIKTPSDKNKLIDTLWFLKDVGCVTVNVNKDKMREKDDDNSVAIQVYASIMCICDIGELSEVEERLESLISTNMNMGERMDEIE